MKKSRIINIVFAVVMAMSLMLGCICTSFAATEKKAWPKTSFPSTVKLEVGESRTLEYKLNPGSPEFLSEIDWSYQTNGCIKVKVNGRGSYLGEPSSLTITGIAPGKATVTVDSCLYDIEGDCFAIGNSNANITVVKKADNSANNSASKPLKSIRLSKSSMSLKKGGSAKLNVTFNPVDTTDSKKIIWTTSNSSVATVSNGTVTAKGTGSAVITAKCGNFKASCSVSVKTGNGFVNADLAYNNFNKFRTKKNNWQWNKGNKSKTYFNTGKGNTLKALKRDADLEKTAKIRAKEIVKKFAHKRPNGKDCFTIYPNKFGYKGENIAYGYSTYEIIDGWAETNEFYNGQGHRRNMLNKNFTSVGIAGYKYNGTIYWVMCLGGK